MIWPLETLCLIPSLAIVNWLSSQARARERTLRLSCLFLPKRRASFPFRPFCGQRPLTDDPQRVVLNYHLPAKYGFVANQFWRHKNHSVLPDALSILKRQGIELPLVLTGFRQTIETPRINTSRNSSRRALVSVSEIRCTSSAIYPIGT